MSKGYNLIQLHAIEGKVFFLFFRLVLKLIFNRLCRVKSRMEGFSFSCNFLFREMFNDAHYQSYNCLSGIDHILIQKINYDK